jgi:hypothetical protein
MGNGDLYMVETRASHDRCSRSCSGARRPDRSPSR